MKKLFTPLILIYLLISCHSIKKCKRNNEPIRAHSSYRDLASVEEESADVSDYREVNKLIEDSYRTTSARRATNPNQPTERARSAAMGQEFGFISYGLNKDTLLPDATLTARVRISRLMEDITASLQSHPIAPVRIAKVMTARLHGDTTKINIKPNFKEHEQVIERRGVTEWSWVISKKDLSYNGPLTLRFSVAIQVEGYEKFIDVGEYDVMIIAKRGDIILSKWEKFKHIIEWVLTKIHWIFTVMIIPVFLWIRKEYFSKKSE